MGFIRIDLPGKIEIIWPGKRNRGKWEIIFSIIFPKSADIFFI